MENDVNYSKCDNCAEEAGYHRVCFTCHYYPYSENFTLTFLEYLTGTQDKSKSSGRQDHAPFPDEYYEPRIAKTPLPPCMRSPEKKDG